LLRYVEPAAPFTEASYRDLFERPELRGLLKGRFLLVGENSQKETFTTPFGGKLGVMIHAYAAHSLLTNGFIRETPWWLSLLFIIVLIYWLAGLAAQGTSLVRLVRFCLLVSLGIFAVAALMIVVGPWWFPVIYPLAALWLLLPLLSAFRKVAAPGACP
jgi:CHASE2 domain-containing sensor protein